jgi:hypothetical protein
MYAGRRKEVSSKQPISITITEEFQMFRYMYRFARGARTTLGAALILVALFSQTAAAADSPSSPFPGLDRVTSKNLANLYRRPDVDTSDYSKIMIGEVGVEFSKNWNPRNYGTFGLSATQLQKIRVDLSALAKSVFSKTLSDGGYDVVTEAGDGVLAVTPNVVNLFINAPDVPTAGRSRTYTMSAGSAGLALLVSDSVTGTLLAAAFDQVRSDSATMRWTTSTSNRAAANAMLKTWADQFKRELDAARAK